jgi:hypothetical protein
MSEPDRNELRWLGVMLLGATAIVTLGAALAMMTPARGETATNNILVRYASRPGATSLDGVVAPLAAKVREIQSACGAKIISAVARRNVRLPPGQPPLLSLHASGRAVDIAGNPACIYPMLQNWPGGYSTDYGRVQPNHVHISFGGREHGRRFKHYLGPTAIAAPSHQGVVIGALP